MFPSTTPLNAELNQPRTESEMYRLVGKIIVNRHREAFFKLPKAAQDKWRISDAEIVPEKKQMAEALQVFWDDVETKFFEVVADNDTQRTIFSMWRGLATWCWMATETPELEVSASPLLP